jgi:hypothetical protein
LGKSRQYDHSFEENGRKNRYWFSLNIHLVGNNSSHANSLHNQLITYIFNLKLSLIVNVY